MRLLQRRRGTRSHAPRRLFQTPRNGLARGLSRQQAHRHRRGALQEYTALVLPERQQPAPQARRHRRRRGIPGTRHRNRLDDRGPRRPADETHRVHAPQRRIQEDLPQGKALRHRTLAGGYRPGARDDDRLAPDRRRHGPQHEDRRRGVSGRQDQGHLLLHRRRTRRLPRTDQGLRRTLPHPHRDEADRRPPGGRAHRRPRSLRPRALLRLVDVEFLERHDRGRTRPGHLAQPPEARRAVLEAQMLHDARIRRLRRCPQGVSARARAAAERRRRVVCGQERHSLRDDDLLLVEGVDGQPRDAARCPREGDSGAQPTGKKGRAAARRRPDASGGRGADVPRRGGQHHPFRPGKTPQARRPQPQPESVRQGPGGRRERCSGQSAAV